MNCRGRTLARCRRTSSRRRRRRQGARGAGAGGTVQGRGAARRPARPAEPRLRRDGTRSMSLPVTGSAACDEKVGVDMKASYAKGQRLYFAGEATFRDDSCVNRFTAQMLNCPTVHRRHLASRVNLATSAFNARTSHRARTRPCARAATRPQCQPWPCWDMAGMLQIHGARRLHVGAEAGRGSCVRRSPLPSPCLSAVTASLTTMRPTMVIVLSDARSHHAFPCSYWWREHHDAMLPIKP